MELSVYKIDGTVAKTVTLNEEIFGITPNDHAIYLDVKQYLANQRQGTAKTKDRSEVIQRQATKAKQNLRIFTCIVSVFLNFNIQIYNLLSHQRHESRILYLSICIIDPL